MWFFGKKKKEKKVEDNKKEESKTVVNEKAVDEPSKEEKTTKKVDKQETIKKEPIKKQDKTVKEKKPEIKEERTTDDTVQNEDDDKQKKSVYRVIFDKEDKLWKIKKDGAKRVIDSKKTKEEALLRVQELSKSQDTKFVVYKKDGKFQKKANLKLKNNDEE